jgi:hypothetical protein
MEIGSHLVTPRRGYVHHGIYVGEGRVIHYAGFKGLLRRGPVEEISLEAFSGGRGFAVRKAVREAAARARSRLGEDRYRFLTNNCEHFAEWCATGQSRSSQVERFLGRLAGFITTEICAA